MRTNGSTLISQAEDEGELSVAELRDMADRQQKQIDDHQQQLVAKEQRLRYLKQQENRHQALTSEAERLRRLRERVESQEMKLRKLRALRGQSEQQRTNNAALIMDLEHIRALFNEKEKELSVAVARVDEMSRQLEEVRRDRHAQRRGASNGTHTALELDKLRRELMYHNQLNEQQQNQLASQRQLIEQKREQMAAVDRRIAELQQRLHRKRTHNQQLAQQINSSATSKKSVQSNSNNILSNNNKIASNNNGNVFVNSANLSINRSTVHKPSHPPFIPNKLDPRYQTLPHSTKFSSNGPQTTQQSTVSSASETPPAEHVTATTVINRLNEMAATAPSGGGLAQQRFRTPPQGASINAQPSGLCNGKEPLIGDSANQRSHSTSASDVNNDSTNQYAGTVTTGDVIKKLTSQSSGSTSCQSAQSPQLPPKPISGSGLADRDSSKISPASSDDAKNPVCSVSDETDRMAPACDQLVVTAVSSSSKTPPTSAAASDPHVLSSIIFNNNNNNNSSSNKVNEDVQVRQSNLSTGGSQSLGRRGRRVSFDPLALLLDASLEGELELVKKTAVEVDDPSASNDEGITALHNSICAGHLDIVQFLVEYGCDVNAQDSDGWTPLHCAASCNNLPMVQFLVERGACIFAATLSDHETAAEKCEEDEEGYHGCSQYLYSVQEKLGVVNGGRVYSLFSYTAQNADELTLSENQPLVILRKGDDIERDWWWARDVSSDVSNEKCDVRADNQQPTEGYVPRNLLGMFPRVARPSKLRPREEDANNQCT